MIPGRLLVLSALLVCFAVPFSAWAENDGSLSGNVQDLNGDVVVRDSKNKLIWQQNTSDVNGDGSISDADKVSWQDAVEFCRDLRYAGSAEWRLPQFSELNTIVDFTRSYPAINPAFICESSYYWTATIYEQKKDNARYIHFNFGSDHWKEKSKKAFVRCVRSFK